MVGHSAVIYAAVLTQRDNPKKKKGRPEQATPCVRMLLVGLAVGWTLKCNIMRTAARWGVRSGNERTLSNRAGGASGHVIGAGDQGCAVWSDETEVAHALAVVAEAVLAAVMGADIPALARQPMVIGVCEAARGEGRERWE